MYRLLVKFRRFYSVIFFSQIQIILREIMFNCSQKRKETKSFKEEEKRSFKERKKFKFENMFYYNDSGI